MSKEAAPTINILESISPDNAASGDDRLIYSGLFGRAIDYARYSGTRWGRFTDSPAGSLEEFAAAWQIAAEGLVCTANEVVESQTEQRSNLWADRFTRASVEIYGEPEIQETVNLIGHQNTWLKTLVGVEHVSQAHVNLLVGTYEPLIDQAHREFGVTAEPIEAEAQALDQYGNFIRTKYAPIFDIIDQVGKGSLGGANLRQLFGDLVKLLAEKDDPAWQDWSVVGGKGKSPQVTPLTKEIKIPDNSVSIAAANLPGLVTHEILVHAMRAKNGFKLNPQLGGGLPGFSKIEEGLASLAEQSVSGKPLERFKDRYIDIGLALGTINGRQMTRRQLFEITYARWLVRAQAKTSVVDRPDLVHKAWNRVDRIYRGGRGDELGSRQAIFTKDASYHSQYKTALRLLQESLIYSGGAGDFFEYTSRAKFDPTNARHIEVLETALSS